MPNVEDYKPRLKCECEECHTCKSRKRMQEKRDNTPGYNERCATERRERLKRYRVASVSNTYLRKRLYVEAWKAERGCSICEERDSVVLDAHHRDKETKHPQLKKSGAKKSNQNLWRLTWDDLEVELEKCDVLCANCHRRVENRRKSADDLIILAEVV